jgi:hypothetical protein
MDKLSEAPSDWVDLFILLFLTAQLITLLVLLVAESNAHRALIS